MAKSSALPLVGVSACLLGERVRYDAGHKRNDFLCGQLAAHVRWLPVCPEDEAGLGTPREPMDLYQVGSDIRLQTRETRRDVTETLAGFADRRLEELSAEPLCGFILKSRSPSCGVGDTPLRNSSGDTIAATSGLFAEPLQRQFPDLPLIVETELTSHSLWEFLTRLFTRHRWREYGLEDNPSPGALLRFHREHELLIAVHERERLGALQASVEQRGSPDACGEYRRLLMQALRRPPQLERLRKTLLAADLQLASSQPAALADLFDAPPAEAMEVWRRLQAILPERAELPPACVRLLEPFPAALLAPPDLSEG